MQISLKQAQRMVLNAQLLDGLAKLTKGKEGIAQTIEKLGYVQIDTISVIERAHHHTLWSRRSDYDPQMLYELQAKDRRIFEYWGHAASYLPMADYRYYLPLMQWHKDPKTNLIKYLSEKSGHLMKPVLKRIEKEGPLSSKDFKHTAKKAGQWWDWKPAKTALELLFWQGALMITERRNFHRVYDLTERVLPKKINTEMPDTDELGRFFVCRALLAYGLAREKEICQHIKAVSKQTISKSLAELVDSGQVKSLRIKQDIDKDYYALTEVLTKSAKSRKKQPGVFILSPFDNLIIQRERIKNLFGFDYTLECYVPVAKRKFGYFVLPILWGDSFMGRLDSKADRKKKNFIIRKLAFEPGLKALDEFLPAFVDKLFELARFNQCEKIKLEKVSPAGIKVTLEDLLKKRSYL